MSAHVPVLRSESINALQVKSGDRYISCTVSEKEHVAVLEHGDIALSDQHSAKKPRQHRDTAILINNNYTEDMELHQ